MLIIATHHSMPPRKSANIILLFGPSYFIYLSEISWHLNQASVWS